MMGGLASVHLARLVCVPGMMFQSVFCSPPVARRSAGSGRGRIGGLVFLLFDKSGDGSSFRKFPVPDRLGYESICNSRGIQLPIMPFRAPSPCL